MGASPRGGVPWSVDAGGLSLTVRLTPKGGRDAIDGIAVLSDGRAVLKVRVRAAPTEGEANAALVSLIAKMLRVPQGQVGILSGQTSRIKRVMIRGDGATLAAAIEKAADSR
jgi:uncharacterized protein (TIGR00251 family)